MSTITAQIQLRRDTSANWTNNNPVLLAGEIALTTDVFYAGTDQPRQKIGNGVDTWLNLDYIPEGGGSSYPENLFLTVVNKTGDNLLATGYKVLKVQDAQGQRLAVDYALADSNGNSVDTIGVVSENIDNNQTGKIIVIGEITGLNTTGSLQGETWEDGDVLYLSSSVAGDLTKVQPTAPNHLVVIGYVVYAHANQGKIYCKVQNGWELGELHDVYAPSPLNNQGIFWSSGTTRYENKSITTVLGYTPENAANKGIANGYAPLGNDTKIDAAYLPSYVSDILEYANLAAFPVTGQSGKIYVALDTNKVYRWSGSIYIEVSANSGVWGSITGTLANQTDLINYLNTTSSSIGNNAVTYSGQYKLNGFYGSKGISSGYNGNIHLQPYLINNPHVITEIGLTVSVAVASSNIRLAVYQDSSGEPGALIYESGNISSATTGFKNFVLPSPLSLTLSQKVVWLAFQVSSGSVSLITGQVFNFIGKQTTGAVGNEGDNRRKSQSFGAFSNPIGANTNVNFSVAMWVRVQ